MIGGGYLRVLHNKILELVDVFKFDWTSAFPRSYESEDGAAGDGYPRVCIEVGVSERG
jgi:hypothetical protein